MANGKELDWAQLLAPFKNQSRTSTADAQKVLASALGADSIAAGVDYYLDNWMHGTEVLRHLYKMLRPAEATDQLLTVLSDGSEDSNRRKAAADLLAVTSRPSDLPRLEDLLAGDTVSQAGLSAVLFQLRWEMDCDTAESARLIKRCLAAATPEALMVALQLAHCAYEDLANRDLGEADQNGLLTTNDIIELFTISFDQKEERVSLMALDALPNAFIPTFHGPITALQNEGGYIGELALELVERYENEK